jgi:hypothetical protein
MANYFPAPKSQAILDLLNNAQKIQPSIQMPQDIDVQRGSALENFFNNSNRLNAYEKDYKLGQPLTPTDTTTVLPNQKPMISDTTLRAPTGFESLISGIKGLVSAFKLGMAAPLGETEKDFETDYPNETPPSDTLAGKAAEIGGSLLTNAVAIYTLSPFVEAATADKLLKATAGLSAVNKTLGSLLVKGTQSAITFGINGGSQEFFRELWDGKISLSNIGKEAIDEALFGAVASVTNTSPNILKNAAISGGAFGVQSVIATLIKNGTITKNDIPRIATNIGLGIATSLMDGIKSAKYWEDYENAQLARRQMINAIQSRYPELSDDEVEKAADLINTAYLFHATNPQNEEFNNVYNALRATYLLKQDVDYIVEEGGKPTDYQPEDLRNALERTVNRLSPDGLKYLKMVESFDSSGLPFAVQPEEPAHEVVLTREDQERVLEELDRQGMITPTKVTAEMALKAERELKEQGVNVPTEVIDKLRDNGSPHDMISSVIADIASKLVPPEYKKSETNTQTTQEKPNIEATLQNLRGKISQLEQKVEILSNKNDPTSQTQAMNISNQIANLKNTLSDYEKTGQLSKSYEALSKNINATPRYNIDLGEDRTANIKNTILPEKNTQQNLRDKILQLEQKVKVLSNTKDYNSRVQARNISYQIGNLKKTLADYERRGQLEKTYGELSKNVVSTPKYNMDLGEDRTANIKNTILPEQKVVPSTPEVQTEAPAPEVNAPKVNDQDVISLVREIDGDYNYGNSVPTWEIIPAMVKKFNISKEEAEKILLDLDDKEIIHLQRYDNPSILPEKLRQYLIPWKDGSSFGHITVRGVLQSQVTPTPTKKPRKLKPREDGMPHIIKRVIPVEKYYTNEVRKKHGIRPYEDNWGLEEYRDGVPQALRRYAARPPDEIASELGFDYEDELYKRLQAEKEAEPETFEEVRADELKVGDKFKRYGELFTVIKKTPKGIVIKDGETVEFKNDDIIDIDTGTFSRNFNQETKETEQPAKIKESEPVKENAPKPKITYQEVAKIQGHKTPSSAKPEKYLNWEKLDLFQFKVKLSNLLHTLYRLDEKGYLDPDVSALIHFIDETGVHHTLDNETLYNTARTLINSYFKLIGKDIPYPNAPSPNDLLERLKQIEAERESEREGTKQEENLQPVAENQEVPNIKIEEPSNETITVNPEEREKDKEKLNQLLAKEQGLSDLTKKMAYGLQMLYSDNPSDADWVKQVFKLSNNNDAAIDELDKMLYKREQELKEVQNEITNLRQKLGSENSGVFKARPGFLKIDPEEAKSGLKQTIDKLKQMLNPQSTKEGRDFATLVEQHRIETNWAIYKARVLAENLRKMGGSRKYLEVVDSYLDNPEKYQSEFDKLPENYKTLYQALKDAYDELYKLASQYGLVDDFIQNYVPHIYTDDPAKVYKLLFPVGGKLGRKFSFGMEREIPTEDEAIKLGLHPLKDPILKLEIYLIQMYKTIANKKLYEELTTTPTSLGLPLLSPEPKDENLDKVWLEDYKGVNVPSFGMGHLRAHPAIADAINDIFSPYQSISGFEKEYAVLSGAVKKALLINPAYHTWNLLTVLFNEINFSPKALVKLFGVIPQDVTERAIKAGLEITKYSNAIREQLYMELKKTTLLDQALSPIIWLEEKSDKLLWDKIFPQFQLVAFDVMSKAVLKQHPDWTQEQADKVVADELNIVYGTIPKSWTSQLARRYGPFFLLTYKWNMAVFDPLVKLFTGGGRGIGSGVFPEWEKQYMKKRMRGFVLKSLLAFFLIGNIVQITSLFVTNKLKEMGILKGKIHPVRFMFDNESGHKLDLDLGFTAADGSIDYLPLPFYKNVRDWIGMVFNFNKTVYKKVAPIPKVIFENLINYSGWKQDKIVPDGETKLRGAWDRLTYSLSQMLPTSYYTEQPGEVKTNAEWALPALGMWVSRGLPGGDIERLFFQFQDEQKLEKNRIRIQALGYLKSNQTEKAINFLYKNGYTENDIIDVLEQYKMPVAYFWSKKMSDDTKIKFLQFLKKHNKTINDIIEEVRKEINYANQGLP